MDTRAALGAAVAVAMTVTGGVSALFLTVGQPSDASITPETAVVEYVDQYGNPVAAPDASPVTPQVILVNADGTPVGSATDATRAGAQYGGAEAETEYEAEYEEDEAEHEEAEHEEGDYEDDDYEEAGYTHG